MLACQYSYTGSIDERLHPSRKQVSKIRKIYKTTTALQAHDCVNAPVCQLRLHVTNDATRRLESVVGATHELKGSHCHGL